MRNKSLKITVAMISYNDERLIGDCLSSIRMQTYDQALISILVVDGGSTDSTVQIAHDYGAEILSRPDLQCRPDIRVGIALTSPKTDLILVFSADNRFDSKTTLEGMVGAFVDEDVVGCQTFHYAYRRADPVLSRYFALIGGNDPIAVELGKADRAPLDMKKWHSFGHVEETKNFFHVKFNKNLREIPTLGANGFLFRGYLNKGCQYMERGLHIDMCADLILNGHNKFSFYKCGEIVHLIGVSWPQFIRRRLAFRSMYSPEVTARIYSIFHASELLMLIMVTLKSVTLILPLTRAVRGFWVVRDPAWFIHPIVLLVFIFAYGMHVVKSFLKRVSLRA